ncbi:hypothetical protein [Streptomyces sp. NBC_01187]|uniref:ATP-dependent DNA ligase n=1 Tax=Streptomyces sp. NBC_01187 TaxID=2903766 RepID=UPI003862E70A|nr:hypothetical protein OG220_00130 [Streptomyces sp. NBC_01187]
MVLTPPVEPMLARPAERLPRRPGLCHEAKWGGFRAVCFAVAGHLYLQTRRGSDLSGAFPEIARAAGDLAAVEPCVLDGELMVAGEQSRLDFELLAARARRTGRRAAESAAQTPAHFVAFDILQLGEEVTMRLPHRRRRELLEDLFCCRETRWW